MKSLLVISGIAVLLCSMVCFAGTFTDSRDGQKYKTVEIDGVTWFAQNLNYETDNSMCYDNDPDNCKKYGRLYSSAEGACPDGWRVGFPQIKNRDLQARNAGWRKDVTYHDQYGFSALPGGFYGQKIVFQNQYGEWVPITDNPSFLGNGSVAAFNDGENVHVIDDLQLFPIVSFGGWGASLSDGYDYMAVSIRCYERPKGKEGYFLDERNNLAYPTIQIGKQIWMKKNLNIETPDSWCYEDNPENCKKYGRLYTWDAAMKACPAGWHLPSSNEFEALFITVGGEKTAGSILKSSSGWKNDGNGEDFSGFTVVPAGARLDGGGFRYAGDYAGFWSSTETNSYTAYYWNFYYNFAGARVGADYDNKGYALSVRCIKDSN